METLLSTHPFLLVCLYVWAGSVVIISVGGILVGIAVLVKKLLEL